MSANFSPFLPHSLLWGCEWCCCDLHRQQWSAWYFEACSTRHSVAKQILVTTIDPSVPGIMSAASGVGVPVE